MVSATGRIKEQPISVRLQPLQQQEQSTSTSAAPPVSEIMSTIEEMIAETNFNSEDQVDALSSSLTTIIGESHPDSLTFPGVFDQVSATSSPSIRSRVSSSFPELSVEGFGTPDPSLPASQLGGNIPLSPMGQQFQELGIPSSGIQFHSKQLEIQPPEVASAVTPTVTSAVTSQQDVLGDDPFSEDAGGPFDISGTDPKKIRQQVSAFNTLTTSAFKAGFRGQDFQDAVVNKIKGNVLNTVTLGTLNTVPAVTYVKDFLNSNNLTHPFAALGAVNATIQVVDTAQRVYQKAARADSIAGFFNGIKNDVLENIEGLWGLATDPLTTIQAKANQQIWGAYSPDITNVNLAHGRLAYVQDERGELTHPGALDTLINSVPFVGQAHRVWNWGFDKTDFKKDLLQKYEDFADATATTDHHINDNMSTYSSGRNNYVNFTERLIGSDLGQFNGTINLNALVGKNVNDLTWDDINSASVDHLFVDQESDRQQIVNAVKNNLGTLSGVGGDGDITSIANNVRDTHAPAREKHWETFKTQYDYIMSQGIEPGTLIGRGDIFGTTGKWDKDKKEWVDGLKPSDLLGPHDRYGRVNQGKMIRDFQNKTVAQHVFLDENLTGEDYVDFTGTALEGRVNSFQESIVQESQFTYQNRDLFSIRNQIARSAQNITGKNYGSNEELHPGKDKDFAAAVLQWGYDTGAKPTEEDLKYLSEYVYLDGENWGTETSLSEKRGDFTTTTATGVGTGSTTKEIAEARDGNKIPPLNPTLPREAWDGNKIPPLNPTLPRPDRKLLLPPRPDIMPKLPPKLAKPVSKEAAYEPVKMEAKIYGGDNFVAKPEADALPSWFSDDPQLEDDPGFDDDIQVDTRTAYEKGISPAAVSVDHLGGPKTGVVAPPATKLPIMLYPETVEHPNPNIVRTPPPGKFDTQISDLFSKTGKYEYLPSKQELWLDRDEFEQGKIMGEYTAYDTAEADKKFIDGVVKSTTEGKKEAKRNNDTKTVEILDYLEKKAWENIDESSKAAAERLDGPKPEDFKNFAWDASLGKFIGDTPAIEKAAVQKADFPEIMGESTEPVYTKTESRAGIASPGFDIEVPPGGTITSPWDGKVKAVGKMRGFPGTLVILEKERFGIEDVKREGGKYHVVITGLPNNLSLTVGDHLLSGESITQGDFGKGSKITVEQRLNNKITSDSTKDLESLIKGGMFTTAGTGVEDMGALNGSGPTREPPEVVTDPARLEAYEGEQYDQRIYQEDIDEGKAMREYTEWLAEKEKQEVAPVVTRPAPVYSDDPVDYPSDYDYGGWY